ncbi:MAG: hypothetical protein M3441_22375 [Chloroflexota bacterium]|nr:hypothetical protein [Chloroflexota bacterium]
MASSPRRLALKYTVAYVLFFFLPFALLIDFAIHALVSLVMRLRRPFSLTISSVGETIGTGMCAGVIAYISFRNLFDPAYQRTSRVDRKTYLTVQLPYDAAFRRCLDSLQLVGKPTILVESRTLGVIDAAVLPDPFWKLIFLSFGDRVQFGLGSDTRGKTVVKIVSRSSLSTVISGSRHHERNIRRIAAFLQNTA